MSFWEKLPGFPRRVKESTQLTYGTPLQWSTENPVLEEGEIVVASDGTLKVGDGTTPYNDLVPVNGSGVVNPLNWGAILGTLSDQTDLQSALDAKIEEAPIDSNEYARSNGGWVEVTTATGGGTSFLPTPDLIDDSDQTYFYFGWTSVSGGWLVRRQERLTAGTLDATQANNGAYASLAAAWTDRLTLNYA